MDKFFHLRPNRPKKITEGASNFSFFQYRRMSNLRSIVLTSLITGVVASGVTYFVVQKTLNDAMRKGKENQDAGEPKLIEAHRVGRE